MGLLSCPQHITKLRVFVNLFQHCHSSCHTSARAIRQSFIDYFVQEQDHAFVRSSPVVPFCDPTVAFVNAGMNQFKGIFLGNMKAPCPRATNSQKCIRVGGKHNDLDVVGTDGYHHTFFEMLGSWSFGDYFKKEACELAWNLLTQKYGLNPSRLYVTYFGGDSTLGLEADVETKDIWRQIGISADRILPFGPNDNFWEMGSTGPCGPCTEIHIDHIPDRSFAAEKVNKGYDDLTELWNLVFIQYNRNADGSLNELPCRHVDTGMGLERLVAVLQGKRSNYDSDLFQPLFQAIYKQSKCVPMYQGNFKDKDRKDIDMSYRILADHARMITVALADGMFPDQNYKLRRVMRKAMLVSEYKFGVNKGLLSELTNYVADSLGEAYPEIGNNLKQIQLIIHHEEELLHSLRGGAATNWQKIVTDKPELKNLDIVEMPGLVSGYRELLTYASEKSKQSDAANITRRGETNSNTLPAELVFKLYDTYGLEESVIKQLAKLQGFDVNIEGFRNLLNVTKARSKGSFSYEVESDQLLESLNKLTTSGLSSTDDTMKYKYTIQNDRCVFPRLECEVKAILVEGTLVPQVESHTECSIILDRTNFYHEAGGQESDKGVLLAANGSRFQVSDIKNKRGYILHHGSINTVGSRICVGDTVIIEVDGQTRLGNMRNHTATHLVNAALRKILTVTCQKSSHVTDSNLVFDFSVYGETFSSQNIEQLEHLVQRCIHASVPVKRSTVTSDELFFMENITLVPGEVYPEQDIHIIEVSIGDILTSREACCGTHVLNTADIKDFCVVSAKTAGSGTRSLRAVTGFYAQSAQHAGQLINADVNKLTEQVECFLNSECTAEQVETLESKLQEVKQKIVSGSQILPYLVCSQLLERLDVLSKKLKASARGILRDALESEMQELLKVEQQPSYLAHFLQCSSVMDTVPLQKATRMCPHIPVLLLAYSEGVLKARCCVPKELVSESFNAELWMQPVLEVLKAKGAPPKGQDPCLVYNMKGKKFPAGNLNSLVKQALQNAVRYAECHFAPAVSQVETTGS